MPLNHIPREVRLHACSDKFKAENYLIILSLLRPTSNDCAALVVLFVI